MDVKTKIFMFYIILIIVLAYIGEYKFPNDSGKEKGALAGVLLSALLWDQYGRDMVEKDKSY
jgi:hypothetical protein